MTSVATFVLDTKLDACYKRLTFSMSDLIFMSGGLELTKEIEDINGFDFSKSWMKYKGKWVAFDMQEGMICAGKDAEQAIEKARTYGFNKAYLYNVDSDETFVPAKKPLRSKKKAYPVECARCEEDFWVSGITEEKAKQLSKTIVLCPSCMKRAKEDTIEEEQQKL